MTSSNIKAAEIARQIKLLILDVDGVLTDGSLYFGADGEHLKVFNSLDGHGIKMLINSGVQVAIITARETPAVAQRVKNLGIQHLYQGRQNKLPALDELLTETGIALEHVAYLGDDLPDLPVILKVGLGMTVSSGYDLLKQHTHWCSEKPGGKGAVREACDFIMTAQGTLQPALDQYLVET